jgi:hypothetical protein
MMGLLFWVASPGTGMVHHRFFRNPIASHSILPLFGAKFRYQDGVKVNTSWQYAHWLVSSQAHRPHSTQRAARKISWQHAPFFIIAVALPLPALTNALQAAPTSGAASQNHTGNYASYR